MNKKVIIIVGIVLALVVFGAIIGGIYLFQHKHTFVIDNGVEATCETSGMTQGKHCKECGEVIVEQKVIPAKGHNIVVDKAVAPTCTSDGKTEGAHCSECNLVITSSTVIPKTEHTFDDASDIICNVCNYERVICHHTDASKIETVAAVEPTCEKTGLTEGKRCTLCQTMIVPQTVVEKVSCREGDWILDYAPSVNGEGKKHTECIYCGKTIREESIGLDEVLGDVEMTPMELVNYALQAFKNDNSVDENKINAIKLLSAIYTISGGKYTADELDELLSSDVMSGLGIDSYQIKQMYGLYLWDKFDNENVTFETILDYLVEISEYPEVKQFMSEDIAAQLKQLADGVDLFKETMESEMTKDEFIEFASAEIGGSSNITMVFNMIFNMASGGAETASFIDILRSCSNYTAVLPSDIKNQINNYIYVYDVIDEDCAYTDFIPVLKKVVLALTNEERDIDVSDEIIQQVYIMYFRERLGTIPNEKIKGIDFVEFVINTIETNTVISSQVSEVNKAKLMDFITISDFVLDVDNYGHIEMKEKIDELKDNITSVTVDSLSFTSSEIQTIYMYYSINN